MIEKKIFPALAADGQLYALSLKNQFWFDLGKPEDYLKGQ
jgi:NDP-sugar pyrophosphorylase family protein